MIVYGINYSQQIENNKATIDTGKVANSFLAGLTLGFSLIATGTHENATNNNKGSTIKLINEMQESDDKLGWRTNDLSRDIESQYRQEIPPKQNCRIM